MRDCPKTKSNVMEGMKVATNCEDGVPKPKNKFYALQSKGDKE